MSSGRTQYEANSISRRKPWVIEKISRTKWYRLRKQERDRYDDTTLTADTLVPSHQLEPQHGCQESKRIGQSS